MENKNGLDPKEQNAGEINGVGADQLGSVPGLSQTTTPHDEQAGDDADHPASSSSVASESNQGEVAVSAGDNAGSRDASLSLPFEGMLVTAAREPLRGNFVFPDSEGGELLRITPDAFIFKGEEIADAGKAYDAFDHVMKITMARVSYGDGGSGGSKPELAPAPQGNVVYEVPDAAPQGRGSFGGTMTTIEEDGRNPVSRPTGEALQKAVAAEMNNGTYSGIELPSGQSQECVLGMTPIRIRLHRDEWVQSMDTEKEIKPTPEAVFDYLNRTMAMPYTREQFKDIAFAHNVGGKYGTGHVVLINGNVIAHTSGLVLDTRKLEPKD